jgi:RND family efflux transporter MFP subunit
MSDNKTLNNQENYEPDAGTSSEKKWKRFLLRFLLAVGILAIAGSISYYWISNRPKAKRKPRVPKAALVEVTKLNIADHHVTIDAMGTVIPARSLDLASRVSGEITRVSPEFFPGGHLSSGDLVVEIDKEDYKLLLEESDFALKKASLAITRSELAIEQSALNIEQSALNIEQRKADIIKAQKDLKVEKGQQKIAKREYEVLGETISENDEELVLRRPQLKAAEAAVDASKARLKEAEAQKKSAEAEKRSAEVAKISYEAEKSQAEIAIEKAKLNLERTDIRAPFNAVIQAKKVETGSQVSVGTPIVTVVDSDEYWIQVSIPVDRLKWIDLPNSDEKKGSSVRIYHEAGWGKGVFRTGTVKRLMTEVETKGRMARLLVSVKDPLSLKAGRAIKPQMILGSYVRVEIEGNVLKDVVCIPRSSLHDENRVWIMQPDNTLDIRKVNIAWSENDSVCVSNNLKDDELLITSDLAAPVQEMALRVINTESPDTPKRQAETGLEDVSKEKRE